jgi:hypothetical protein
MKRLDTKAIRARADAATAGPWAEGVSDAMSNEQQLARLAQRLLAGTRTKYPCVWVPSHPETRVGADADRPEHAVVICDLGNGPTGDANMAFIAAARTDVPALCDRVEALERALRCADENARDFLNDVLDVKYLGVVERGDARPLREISQVARAVLEGE